MQKQNTTIDALSPIAEKFAKGLDDLTEATSNYEYVIHLQMVPINLDSPEGFDIIDKLLNMGGLWHDEPSYGYLQEDITDEIVYDMLYPLSSSLEDVLMRVLDRLGSIHSLISDTVIANEVRPLIQKFNMDWFGKPCGEEAFERLEAITAGSQDVWWGEFPLQYQLLGQGEPNFLYRSVHG